MKLYFTAGLWEISISPNIYENSSVMAICLCKIQCLKFQLLLKFKIICNFICYVFQYVLGPVTLLFHEKSFIILNNV